MYKLLTILLVAFSICSCKFESKQKSAQKDNLKVEKNTFAVIWEWKTDDIDFINENSAIATNELIKLWESDIIENVYYDGQPTKNKLGYFPSISFFIKSESEINAKVKLNKLTIVKKDIASFQLFPVGMLWLGKKGDFDNKNQPHSSYVSVWTSTIERQPISELTKEQNDTILSLWNRGIIENVYFDIEGVTEKNDKTDFVFYINANSQNDAESICKSLPFYKNGIANFKLHQAGTLWMPSKN